MLGKKDLEENLKELPRWSAGFEVPDVNHFRDVVRYHRVFLDLVALQLENPVADPLLTFSYPKDGGNSARDFVLLTPRDLVLARGLAGEIARRTDVLLPPNVFSNRLATPPPRWRFRRRQAAHAEMRRLAQALLIQHGGMSKTDIKNYYPSINVDLLRLNLLALGCDRVVVEAFTSLVEGWQAGGCSGIPIGGEAFGVLGNAYILPLDIRLAAHRVPYVRWVDDIYWFGRDLAARLAALELMDQEMTFLDVERALEKTVHFTDVEAGLAAIADGMLTSLFERGPAAAHRFRDRVRAKFLEYVVEEDEVVPRQYRGLLRTMQNRRDRFAIHYLILKPNLLNVDPAVVGDYLSEVVPNVSEGEALVDLLRQTRVQDRNTLDARDLHLLRALATRTWGREEGQVFWEIAMDDTRRAPVRAWAIAAAARTPAWVAGDVVERVLEERDWPVQRALVLSLYRAKDDERVRRLSRHLRRWRPDLVSAVEWVQSGRRLLL